MCFHYYGVMFNKKGEAVIYLHLYLYLYLYLYPYPYPYLYLYLYLYISLSIYIYIYIYIDRYSLQPKPLPTCPPACRPSHSYHGTMDPQEANFTAQLPSQVKRTGIGKPGSKGIILASKHCIQNTKTTRSLKSR